jgi:tripartite-type tricarboxylate transporter receptor subunit TctC
MLMRHTLANAAAVAFVVCAATCLAQSYPTRPVRIVAPSSPGGTSDFLARLVAQKLTDAFGQQFVVENRPGASSMVGADAVARSTPDGYTLLLSPAALVINPSMYAKVPFDAKRDLAAVTLIAEGGNVLVCHPSLPVRNVKELIALAKARPGSLVAASPGIGGSPHMSAELFKLMAGVDILVVSYKGAGPGAVALLSGEVSLMFTTPPTAMGHIRAGKMRPLAVTTTRRIPALTDVPTIAEAALPGYEVTQWFGLLVAAGTPAAIVERLNRELVRALRTPELKERFAAEGLEPVGNTPAEFASFIHAELDKWAKVIRAAGIKPQSDKSPK